jgi:hypothetical protein
MMGGIKSYSEEHEMKYWKCDFSVTKYILEGIESLTHSSGVGRGCTAGTLAF